MRWFVWLMLFIGGALNPGSAAAGMGAAPGYAAAGGDAPSIQVISFDGVRAELSFGPIVAVFERDPGIPGATKHTDAFVRTKSVWLLPAVANPGYFADKQICSLPIGKNRWGRTLMCGSLDSTQRARLEYTVPEGARNIVYPEPLTWALYGAVTDRTPQNLTAWVGQAENSKHPFLRHDNVRVDVTVLIIDAPNRRIRLVPELSAAERQEMDNQLKALR